MYINVKEQQVLTTHLKVSKVVDGDGLLVTNLFGKQEFEIRLLGIDAPELKICRKLNQDERETHLPGQLLMKMGIIAQKFMIEIAPPKTDVTIGQEKENPQDIYGRTLAYVYLPDGRCLNEIMITEGYAKPYDRHFCNQLPRYQELSSIAKSQKKGLYALVDRF
jgi:micrococcal nuclease